MKTALLMLCFIVAGCDQMKPSAQHMFSAQFQLVSDGAGHVWKMNVITGELWMCAIGGGGDVKCHSAPNQP